MEWLDPIVDLIKVGGPVLIAVIVGAALVGGVAYLGYRFIVAPAQRQSRAIAEAQREAARQNALAAKAHEESAKANAETSQANAETSKANARTAAHLERLTQMLLESAVMRKPA